MNPKFTNSVGILVEDQKKYESHSYSARYNGHDADEMHYYRTLEIIED